MKFKILDSNVSYIAVFSILVFLLLGKTVIAQQKLNGVVTDSLKVPLPGVTVKVKGESSVTLTNEKGEFTVSVKDESSTILFSAIGFESKEIVAGKLSGLSVILSSANQELAQVLVVGYGVVKKRDLTGSVGSIKGSEFNEQPLVSVQQAIRGKVAGVQVNTISGAPGAGLNIRVRGGTSINAGMEPLYVIDGIPVYTDQSFTAADPMSTINPSDIESIEILKDASATAIYGSRGANGVVLVTTKKGKEGATSIILNIKGGIQQRTKKLDLLNAEEFWALADQGYRFSRQFSNIQNPIKDVSLNYADVDWQDEVFRIAPMENYEFSMTGGNNKTTYAASFGYLGQKGIVIGSDFKRLSGRINVDNKVNDKITIGANLIASNTNRNFIRDVLSNAVAMVPFMPIYDRAGKYAYLRDYSNFGTATTNPVALANESSNRTISDRLLGSTFFNVDFLKDFSFRFTGSVDLTNNNISSYIPSTIEPGRNVNGIAGLQSSRMVTLLQESIFSYKKQVGTIHNISAIAGFSSQGNVTSSRGSNAQGFITNFFGAENVGAAERINNISSNKGEFAINSFISRANYSLLDRYLFTVSFRADGSSRFGENNKWGFFPSGAFAWRASNEAFLRGNKTITDLKIRGSYGITGNQEIGLYRSIQRVTSSMVSLSDATSTSGFYTSSLGYNDLSWERTGQINIGLDLALFNKINITADYYNKRTDGVLFEVTAPPSSGFTSYLKNAGVINNKGVELGINTTLINKSNFSWDMSFNISANRNKVLDLGGSNEILLAMSQGYSLVRLGLPVGVFYGYEHDGTFKTQQEIDNTPWAREANQLPGHTKLRDIASIDANGNRVLTPDGYITEADQTVIGNPNPDFIFGFSSGVKWKSFDLNLSMYGSYGNDVFNVILREANMFAGNKNTLRSTLNSSLPASVSPDGVARITNVPIATYTFTGRSRFPGGSYSNNVEDGSFIRMSDLTIGYTLPVKPTNFIKKSRVYVMLQNVFTITNYSGYDPDVSNQYGRDSNYPSLSIGYDADPYPVARIVNFGLSVNF